MYAIKTETIEYMGLTAKIEIYHQDGMGAPWLEYEGHGIIRELSRYENKKPGEIILHSNGRTRYAYDIQATKELAIRDAWGCSNPKGLTRNQIIEKAIRSDIEYCEGWLLDKWQWVGFVVEIDDEHVDSCWGFDNESYCMESGKESAFYELKDRYEKAQKESADREYLASHDVETI